MINTSELSVEPDQLQTTLSVDGVRALKVLVARLQGRATTGDAP